MKNVDKTIDSICDFIQEELEGICIIPIDELAELTKALAELISARAQS